MMAYATATKMKAMRLNNEIAEENIHVLSDVVTSIFGMQTLLEL